MQAAPDHMNGEACHLHAGAQLPRDAESRARGGLHPLLTSASILFMFLWLLHLKNNKPPRRALIPQHTGEAQIPACCQQSQWTPDSIPALGKAKRRKMNVFKAEKCSSRSLNEHLEWPGDPEPV